MYTLANYFYKSYNESCSPLSHPWHPEFSCSQKEPFQHLSCFFWSYFLISIPHAHIILSWFFVSISDILFTFPNMVLSAVFETYCDYTSNVCISILLYVFLCSIFSRTSNYIILLDWMVSHLSVNTPSSLKFSDCLSISLSLHSYAHRVLYCARFYWLHFSVFCSTF
jgi:hypothetical protein